MSMPTVRRVIVIQNEQGLHARPAEMFVRKAKQFDAKIALVRENHRINASSIMELLTLGAAKGTQLTLEAEGPDAQAAVDLLAELVESGFPQEDKEAQQ